MNALARAGAVCTSLYLGLGGGGWWAVAAESPAVLAVEVAQNFFSARPASVPIAQSATAHPSTAPSQLAIGQLVAGQVKWEVLARSVEGRPIEFAQFGDGQHQVLVVGSLEGDKPEGLAIAEMLASHLVRFPRRLGDVTVTVVRDPNPDGRARRTSVNARGVELDRNFQTSGWRQAPAGRSASSGHQPESEPETRALVELLADLKPERVVLLATAVGRVTVSYVGASESLARPVARDGEAQLVAVDAAKEPGSLLTLASLERGIPAIRFGLVPRPTADAIWSELKAGLMTAIGCGATVEFPKPVEFPKSAVSLEAGQTKPEPCASPETDSSPPASPSQPSRQPIGILTSSPRVVPSPAATEPGAANPVTRPAIGEAARAAVEQPMQFQNIRHGVPNVRVVSPRASSPPAAVPPPAAPPAEPAASLPVEVPTVVTAPQDTEKPSPVSAAAAPVSVQRLPSVDVMNAPLPRVVPKNLPQAPIPVYPNTGL